jgi:hypothetical protein
MKRKSLFDGKSGHYISVMDNYNFNLRVHTQCDHKGRRLASDPVDSLHRKKLPSESFKSSSSLWVVEGECDSGFAVVRVGTQNRFGTPAPSGTRQQKQ